MNLFYRNNLLCGFIPAFEYCRKMSFTNFDDFLVFIVEGQVLSLLLEMLYPVINDFLVFMIKDFEWVRFGNIIADGQSMEIILRLIYVNLKSDQRDNLCRNPLITRIVNDQSLVSQNVPPLLHQVRELAHLEEVALFNNS